MSALEILGLYQSVAYAGPAGIFSVSGQYLLRNLQFSTEFRFTLWTRKLTSIPHEIPLCMNSSLNNVPANRFSSSTWNRLEGFFTKKWGQRIACLVVHRLLRTSELDFSGCPFLILEMRRQNNSPYICLTYSIC